MLLQTDSQFSAEVEFRESEDSDGVAGRGDPDFVTLNLTATVVPIGDDEQDAASRKLRELFHDVVHGAPQMEGFLAGGMELVAVDGCGVDRGIETLLQQNGIGGLIAVGTNESAVEREDGDAVLGFEGGGDPVAEVFA